MVNQESTASFRTLMEYAQELTFTFKDLSQTKT